MALERCEKCGCLAENDNGFVYCPWCKFMESVKNGDQIIKLKGKKNE